MVSKEEAKEQIKTLLERYHRYKNDQSFISNEKQVGESLIKPFINKVLGWDVSDPAEFRVEYQQGGKRIDYVVMSGGISQFVVEIKALSKEIINNTEFYRQAFNYGRGRDKIFAILANFRDFIILNCTADVGNNILQSELERVKADELLLNDDKFEIIWNFSKEKWLNLRGENNNPLILKSRVKRRKPLDEELLEDMSNWRIKLLKSLKEHPRLNDFINWDDKSEIEYVEEEIQRFVDRLVFICFCEDKEIYDKRLKPSIFEKRQDRNMGRPYLLNKIREIFSEYRNDYNSDLFEKEGWCDKFNFDDIAINEILVDLREPHDRIPYDFATIDEDILGKTYENFIGHLISGKSRFKEKEDIGKRKKEGIYYTPKYIVEFILNNTLRPYVKNKSFEEIKKVKILDPACGSASFLRKAFDILVDESQNRLGRDLIYEEKIDLVLNCIYGVDKDKRACDIAKLSFSLKLADRGKSLPILRNNIRNGDSIIDDKNIEPKAFVWEEEFKDIFGGGGFDVVVGNPPYLILKETNTNLETIEYLNKNYTCADFKINAYALFIEKGIMLLKEGGYFGFIIPDTLLNLPAFKKARVFILKNCSINKIIYFNSFVFGDAEVGKSIIVIFQKGEYSDETIEIRKVEKDNNINDAPTNKLKQSIFQEDKEVQFNISLDKESYSLEKKIKKDSIALSDICVVCDGINPGSEEIKNIVIIKNCENKLCKKIIDGKEFSRYSKIIWSGNWIKYDSNFIEKLRKEIQRKGLNFTARIIKKDQFFEKEKIITRQTADKLIGTVDYEKYYTKNSVHSTYIKEDFKNNYDLRYILALINSKVLNYYYILLSQEKGRLYPQVKISRLEALPIKDISLERQQPFIKLVDKMLSLNKRLNEIGDKRTEERTRIEKEIKKNNEEIDKLVYQIYGITNEEQDIIEKSLISS